MTFAILTACYFSDESPIWRLKESCRFYGIKLIPYGVGETFSNWRESKIDGLRAALKGVTEDIVMYADGQDTFAVAGEDEITYRFKAMAGEDIHIRKSCVVAGERNYWPNDGNSEVYRKDFNPDCPFVYPNAGMFIAYRDWLGPYLDSLSGMALGGNDQSYWHAKAGEYLVDCSTNIFACMSDDDVGEGRTWQWDGNRLKRQVFGGMYSTMFLHFNGGNKEERMKPVWDEWMARRG